MPRYRSSKSASPEEIGQWGVFSDPLLRSLGLRENARLADEIMARVPERRWGMPRELVGAYVFLASDESSFVNGETIYVDGGYHAV